MSAPVPAGAERAPALERMTGAVRRVRRSIALVCDPCGRAIHHAVDGPLDAVGCPACGAHHPLLAGDDAGLARPLGRCLRCGLDRLYTQKDFNRRLGLGVFAVAALLSVPTWGLSLVAATLLDLALYHLLGEVTICYGCNTQHRGFPANPAHAAFDLHVAETVDRRRPAVPAAR